MAFTTIAFEALSEIVALDFGLKKIILNNCQVDEHMIKELVHSLLVVDRLEVLRIINNEALNFFAFKYLSVFLRKVNGLNN